MSKALTFSLGELFGLPPKPIQLDRNLSPKDGDRWMEPCSCGQLKRLCCASQGNIVWEGHHGQWLSLYSVLDGGKDFDRYGVVPACYKCQLDNQLNSED